MKIKFILSLLLLTFFACKKEEDKSAPRIYTTGPFENIYNSVKCGGSSIDNGSILEKGLCWSDTKAPDINGDKLIVGDGDADFEANITGLLPNHSYFVRAYATNKYRTGYGQVIGVTTGTIPETPIVQSLNTYSITKTSVLLKGMMQSFGVLSLDSFGVCWSTHANPTKTDNLKLVELNPFSSDFSVMLNDLNPNTLYYIRSFTATDYGTVYSNNTTLVKTYYDTVTDYDGNVYYTVKIGEMEWMAENLKVTRFNDGTNLQHAYSTSSWYNATQAAYCENSLGAGSGNLYNWFCAYNTKNIAPVGWHVPKQKDWESLIFFCGGADKGNSMRIQGNDYWYAPNKATNESGFSAIGTGYRYPYGEYTSQLGITYFWVNNLYSYAFQITAGNYVSLESVSGDLNGFCIRCLKD